MHNTVRMPNPDLIATVEVCEILGYADPSAISRLVTAGRLTPAYKLPGPRGAFLFNRADVEALAAERHQASPESGDDQSRAAHPSNREHIEPDQANPHGITRPEVTA